MGELTGRDVGGMATALAGGLCIVVALNGPTSSVGLVLCGTVVSLVGLLGIRFQ